MQTLSGSLGNLWKKLTVTMANRTDPYEVVIEATVRGNNGNFEIWKSKFKDTD